ncbi:Peptidase family M28 [Pricia antarctica]|uniref:Vacuolar membrane protease n=1 Tax=Pricia antarctica TaxID=641691 RepID=A0A1G6WDM7_9FLAO|nr:M28 family peptidase [Pricia antarctica]SDD63864.1 Peptidase family M28 [Pricia antarctica]
MKKLASVLSLLLVLLAIYWSFRASMPVYKSDAALSDTLFSTDRALTHVKALSQKPHGVGFPAHEKVRKYLIDELKKMGLKTSTQEGYSLGKGTNLSKAKNILARIEGTGNGKALLLLSHYDSSPHSSLGASDAGSGVATILESVRAFLSTGKQPKNDIIILISDAEELGLNGAQLFVDKHPWAKDVGLVLNFEARGSGGPSYAFIETNRGNQNLLLEFIEAHPEYPMANSLYYSIYKMLPNDTDLTVFRENRDIDGFNFAFIDDHYDYHTAQDAYERLDKNTLAHQGSYLMPLLHHFVNADLNHLKSLNDFVYFNMPFFGMVSYPFEWIWPMFGLAVISFIVLIIYGFRRQTLKVRGILGGFLPLLITLAINGIVGFYTWPMLKSMYPGYQDILHGFTYNGHTYIAAFVLFAVSVCFGTYYNFRRIAVADLLVAPLLLWIVLCGLLAVYLEGASFFIVPVFGLLAAWYVAMDQKRPSLFLMVFLALPAIWLYSPLIVGFTVGLGLKMLVASTLLTTLTFFLLLPVFGFYRNKKSLAYIGLVLFFGYFVSAHFNSGFDADTAKPSSLVYIINEDANSAQWATYDQVLIDWNNAFLGKEKQSAETGSLPILSSKYNLGFSYVADAEMKGIKGPSLEKKRDTIIGEERLLEIRIVPQRNVNRLEIFTNNSPIISASVNGLPLSSYDLPNKNTHRLVTHYISDNDATELRLTIPKTERLVLTFNEASNDLLQHPFFEVPQRPANSIPMPFVLNDAIITVKTLVFDIGEE